MKLMAFRADGKARYGWVDGNQVRALPGGDDLRPWLLERGKAARYALEPESSMPSWALTDVEFLPPVADPLKILCVGLNYHEHVQETGRSPAGYPTLFTRFADTQIGHGAPIVGPAASDKLDWEGELAVLIGLPGRNIPEADALSHVGGYSCFNDVSVRDWQKHGTQWTPGKNFPATGPVGPWIVTADEIQDSSRLSIATRVNGITMQSANTSQLIFSIPQLIAYISRFTPLGTGDVICTGTPGGVGFARKPPLYLKDGDVVEVEIEGIGVLRNAVVLEAGSAAV